MYRCRIFVSSMISAIILREWTLFWGDRCLHGHSLSWTMMVWYDIILKRLCDSLIFRRDRLLNVDLLISLWNSTQRPISGLIHKITLPSYPTNTTFSPLQFTSTLPPLYG